MTPPPTNETEERASAPAENPASGRGEGRTQELQSRIDVHEKEMETFATREWVYHRVMLIAVAVFGGVLYFMRDVMNRILDFVLKSKGISG